jgi:hypothetical protein
MRTVLVGPAAIAPRRCAGCCAPGLVAACGSVAASGWTPDDVVEVTRSSIPLALVGMPSGRTWASAACRSDVRVRRMAGPHRVAGGLDHLVARLLARTPVSR